VQAPSEDALRAAVGRWVLAFDPCVPCQLHVRRTA
jgi:Ni,Fe-hydrogenase I large subunit